jgi:N-acetylmuramoyl-L-alanine amidase
LFTLILLLAALLAPAARAAIINGHAYTSVSDWAAANGFRLQSRSGGTMIYINRAQTRLGLEKDSSTAQINGVNVALSFPAACDKGEMYISQLDLAKTINPLIFLQAARKKTTTICLDPGHGGKDTGNHTGSRYEKTYALLLAQELASQLKAAGFKVILTRNKDTFVELSERPDTASRKNADLFISLHFNATESAKAEVNGPETYCITPVGAASSNAQGEGAGHGACAANAVEKNSLLLAYQVHRALVKNLGAEDRSVRRARFAVLRDARMPAILVESGYMTHPVEGKKIFDAAYRQQIASAIVKGILNYQKLTAPAATVASPAGTNKVSKTGRAKGDRNN